MQRQPSQLLSSSLSGAHQAKTSKPQRPTSLPIRPFVLVPAGETGAPQVGGLLDQYMSQRSSKVSTSQPGSKFKGRRSRCFSSLQLSPMGSHYPVFLEPPSSSDTCSSCTPSPEWWGRRHTWSQSSRPPRPFSPCTAGSGAGARRLSPKRPQAGALEDTSPHSEVRLALTPPPNRSTLIKIPTYQDLNNLSPKLTYTSAFNAAHTSYQALACQSPPTLPLSAHGRGSSPSTQSEPEQLPLQPPGATSAADPGFLQGGFAAAFSSLSSLLSFAASVRTSQAGESLLLSDEPPTEFRLSPEASYESMSISHLQRRGEMASAHLATPSSALLLGWLCLVTMMMSFYAAAPSIPRRGFLSNMTYF